MAKVAFMTLGLLHFAIWDPRVQGFVDRLEAIYHAVETSDGFVDRSIRDELSGEHMWGDRQIPAAFQNMDFEDRLPQTLSLWEDLESVFAFAYDGVHKEALSKRKD